MKTKRALLSIVAALTLLPAVTFAASTNDLLTATRKASDLAASAAFPSSMVSSTYAEGNAAGEPYLIKCTANADRIILYLHSWSGDMQQVKTAFPELATLTRACIVAPNFGGPNSNPQAMGSDDSLARIDIAVKEVQYKTGLSRIYLVATSGGTMASLNYMGKYPGKIHRASLWLIIGDLSSLYATTQDQSLKTDMLTVFGAAPTGPEDAAYLARSPRARLPGIYGPTEIFLNVGTLDTTSPKVQGEAVKAQLDALSADGIKSTLLYWPITHVFDTAQRSEAIKQLILE